MKVLKEFIVFFLAICAPLIILAIALILSGCVLAVPYNECDEVYFSAEEVQACEERAIRREDHRVEFEERKRLYGIRAALCWRAGGGYWDASRKQCIEPGML